ncbi:hypothetical protein [Sneathiella glossodoripedis]|uniref:hypothetical protein n=1 Tax=Sneathiella glossodoripedis TaxID=418853 RepID=UPI0018FFEF64|nr:hypothetical protein [Sneathiella glossodoripedis]
MSENPLDPKLTGSGREIRLPQAPVLVLSGGKSVWLTADGEIMEESIDQARLKVAKTPPLLAHRLACARKLDINPFSAFDILELFAFTFPARQCLPTVRGIAKALDLEPPTALEDQALSLFEAASRLLEALTYLNGPELKSASQIAMTMSRSGWNWGPRCLLHWA